MSVTSAPNDDNPLETQRAALEYARRGWPVLPMGRAKKRALITSWPQRATTDTDIVRRWFDEFDDPDIGILTGQRSGIVVLDIDGETGEKSLAGMPLPETAAARTRRGRHLYLAAPSELTTSRLDLLPDVDFLGDRRCVKAPPSRHDAGTYTWVRPPDTTPIAPAPDWLTELLRTERAEPQKRDAHTPKRRASPGAHGPLAQSPRSRAIAGLLDQFWRSGVRHQLALDLAGYLAVRGWPVEEVRATVRRIMKVAGDNDWSDRTRSIDGTFARIAKGHCVSGWRALEQLLPGDVVVQLDRLAAPVGVARSRPAESGAPKITADVASLLSHVARIGGGHVTFLHMGEAGAALEMESRKLRRVKKAAVDDQLLEVVRRADNSARVPQAVKLTARGVAALLAFSDRFAVPGWLIAPARAQLPTVSQELVATEKVVGTEVGRDLQVVGNGSRSSSPQQHPPRRWTELSAPLESPEAVH